MTEQLNTSDKKEIQKSTIKNYGDFVIEEEYIDSDTGKKCIVTFNRLGFRCGYVELPEKIKFSKIREDCVRYETDEVINTIRVLSKRRGVPELHLYVHGGVTFLGYKFDMRSVGFDCGHFMDKADIGAYKEYFGTNDALYKAVSESARSKTGQSTIKDVLYVKEELAQLAKQISLYENQLKDKETQNKLNWKHHEHAKIRRERRRNRNKFRRL